MSTSRENIKEKVAIDSTKTINAVRIVLISLGLIVAGMMLQASTSILPNVSSDQDSSVGNINNGTAFFSVNEPMIKWYYNDTYINQTFDNIVSIELSFITTDFIYFVIDYLDKVTAWYSNSTNTSTLDNYPENTIMGGNEDPTSERYTIILKNSTNFEYNVSMFADQTNKYVLSSVNYLYNNSDPIPVFEEYDYRSDYDTGRVNSEWMPEGFMELFMIMFVDMMYAPDHLPRVNETIANMSSYAKQKALTYIDNFSLDLNNKNMTISLGELSFYQQEMEYEEPSEDNGWNGSRPDDYLNVLDITIDGVHYKRYSNGTIIVV